MVAKKKCIDEWVLQAYIDVELDDDSRVLVEKHLSQCSKCTQRLAERKQRIVDVFEILELADGPERAQFHRGKRQLLIWATGIAASLLIMFSLFNILQPQHREINESVALQCDWVEVDAANFFPDFESPNKLYRMRAMVFTMYDAQDNKSEHYLIKQCYLNDNVN